MPEERPQFDFRFFPGGQDLDEIVSAIQISAIQNLGIDPRRTVLEDRALEGFWTGLQARHPGKIDDPFGLRSAELMDERSLLLHSHLRLSWFTLAYWSYALIAVRSGLAPHLGLRTNELIARIRFPLYELGVDLTEEECRDEVDRFVPEDASPENVVAATQVFLDFVRFLHRAALRRRETVTPGLNLASVGVVMDRKDEEPAHGIVSYLRSHGIRVLQRADEVEDGSRLLVVLSEHAVSSTEFWSDVAAWRSKPVSPMVLCLTRRADLYGKRPSRAPEDLWTWLRDTVAVELGQGRHGYSVLLQALDAPHPRRWWWHVEDGMSIGLANDLLGLGIPRPSRRSSSVHREATVYPYGLDQTVLRACAFGSYLALRHVRDGFTPDPRNGRHAPYAALCYRLEAERKRWCGDAYALPWLIVVYRAWLTFAAWAPEIPQSSEAAGHTNQELLNALPALGVHPHRGDIRGFLEAFDGLPWTAEADPVARVDGRTATFVALIHHLSQSAVAAHQPVQLKFPVHPCFVSYARQDEDLARKLVKFVEGKGADVWFDLTSITLGAALDDSLRDAVSDARILFLIGSAAADRSEYVRMEVETALARGLQIVPVTVDGELPPGFAALQASNARSFLPPVRLHGREHEDALTELLTHLDRSPEEQLQWLQSQVPCARMIERVRRMRADGEVPHH